MTYGNFFDMQDEVLANQLMEKNISFNSLQSEISLSIQLSGLTQNGLYPVLN